MFPRKPATAALLPLSICAVFACALSLSVPCLADSAPFGVASAFSLVALGYGSTPGNISDSADITGRIAAAGQISQSTTIGSGLSGNDPYGALADGYAVVAGGGVTASNYFNIDGGGSVYAPTNTAGYNWNENPHGSLIKTGSSPINFGSLASSMDALSLQLAGLTGNGIVGAPTPKNGNPSWFVLSGTSTTLNIFTITAAEFASTNNPLDIQVPAGSTVIINVLGTSDTLGAGIYFNGKQETDADAANILFNFAGASSVSIDGQFDGALLAPFADLTGGSQMGGTFIAAEIGQTGEVHYDAFCGTLPDTPSPTPTPEPGTLVLMASGLLAMALVVRRAAA